MYWWSTGQKELDHPFKIHFDSNLHVFQGVTSAYAHVLNTSN